MVGVFWPAPAGAVAFLLAIVSLGYTTWVQMLPGVQAIFIMSLLQCCWGVMSWQGQRRLLRLAQVASALLGILALLPQHDIYGTRIWVSAFDDESGVVLPGFAASLATLFGFMGTTASGNGDAKAYQWGYGGGGRAADADFNRALLYLEVSLAAVVVLWLLQAATAAPATAGIMNHTASTSLMQSSYYKSHLDLPAMESLEGLIPACRDPTLRPDALGPAFDSGAQACSAIVPLGCCIGQRNPQYPGQPDGELQHDQNQAQQKPSRSPAAACGCQRVLLAGACLAQSVAATVIVGTWDALARRLRPDDSPPSASKESNVGQSDSQEAPSFDGMRASCLELGLLAAAMAATLTLPALTRSRHLLHTALLARPAATRSLGLLLLDVNAAKLLLSVSVGVLGGWRSGVLTWQLLQVCTVVFGVAKMYAGALKEQLASATAAATAMGPLPPPSGLSTAEEAAARPPMQVVPVGAGCCEAASVAPTSSCLAECASASAVAASPGFGVDAMMGRGANAGALLQDRRRDCCGSGFRVVPEVISPAVLSPAPASGCRPADVACATTASAATTSGCRSSSDSSCITLHSPYSSGNSLASAANDDSSHPGHGESNGGGGGAPCPSSCTMTTAQLARRPPSLIVAGHTLRCSHHHHHQQQQQPLLPSGACDGGGGSRLLTPLPTGRRPVSTRCGCGGVLAAVAAVLHPWSLLLVSLSFLGCMLWVVLMSPPLALLGDEPEDFFESLVDTGPGAAAMLMLLVGIATAFTVAGTCLLLCIANGELRQRLRLNPVERRRLECLAWACGPPLAVAVFSALSWALGDERNAVAYIAAEALRCASLWPLVWLQEPWLVGGVDCVGGCVQHAGCGVTCCVLRWAGLRPSGSGALGGRCDERVREAAAGMQLARTASRRGRAGSGQVEMN
ncbi:hypothetical protein PLESTB_001024700 [Pleodorina starrii]|uniref:Uncharacterized protein n=1 Tax=Pleodorina starrii TaxID=330485 RepID=A0A9W6BPT3_9CHLO|nr:hypothetical protein PLESTM_001817300 [Pleodorina starrii]GLC55750.1 hypothetical protein PLESTB_001024700 [Pleodorina starrii]GLC68822.1 hypothetical protein PLESTF_000742200 [Pleodorina starrii]